MSAYAERALIVTFPPVPLFTRSCPFGYLVSFGGLSFDRAPLYSRATGPFSIKICKRLPSIVHRLVPAYLFGAAVVAHPATAQLPRFCPGRRCSYSIDTF